jgi:hypothetical protein
MAEQFSDVLDQAQHRIEIDLAQSIQAQRARALATPRPVAEGCCKNPRCAEPFAQNAEKRLFCGPNCAMEYERYRR